MRKGYKHPMKLQMPFRHAMW